MFYVVIVICKVKTGMFAYKNIHNIIFQIQI